MIIITWFLIKKKKTNSGNPWVVNSSSRIRSRFLLKPWEPIKSRFTCLNAQRKEKKEKREKRWRRRLKKRMDLRPGKRRQLLFFFFSLIENNYDLVFFRGKKMATNSAEINQIIEAFKKISSPTISSQVHDFQITSHYRSSIDTKKKKKWTSVRLSFLLFFASLSFFFFLISKVGVGRGEQSNVKWLFLFRFIRWHRCLLILG